MVISILRVLSQRYGNGQAQFVGIEELKQISERILKSSRSDMVFSSKYLCYKYVLQMVAIYLDEGLFRSTEMHSWLLVILGRMPFELFSASEAIVFTDREGLEYAAYLIDRIGKENIENIARAFLNDIF